MNPFVDGWTRDDVEAAIERNRPEELLSVPVWVSMDPPDCAWAQEVCVRLTGHPNSHVRSNAVPGFGHLARTCGVLDEARVRPLIEGALRDLDEYVRGQAEAAAGDVAQYLGWQFATYPARGITTASSGRVIS
jgi:hypothetical protein